MSAIEISLIIVSIILAGLFIVLRATKGGMIGILTKTLASFGFVTSAIVGLIVSDITGLAKVSLGLIVIGLLCGMIGDIVLDLKVVYPNNDKYYLNAGMLAFFVGHIFYVVSFSLLVLDKIKLGLPLIIAVSSSIIITLFIVLSSKKMGLNFGKFLIQTILYTLILSFTMIYTLVISIMTGSLWLLFIAMLLFFLSDVVLSFQYFGGKLSSKLLIVVNHSLYYMAQILLVIVLFKIN